MKDSTKAAPKPAPKAPPFPGRLLLDMYGGCNLKCAMCLVHSRRRRAGHRRVAERTSKRVMPLEGLQRILDEAAKAAPKPLLFTSFYGEPLATPSFGGKVYLMKRKGFQVVCHTNGILCDEDLCRFFVEIGLDAVSFSLDATRPETYKAIRGVDKLRRLEETVKMLLRARDGAACPRIGVSFTRQDVNMAEEEGFVERWRDVVDVVRVNASFSGGAPVNHPYLPAPEKRAPCGTLYRTMPIFYNGDVGLCCRDSFGDYQMGNVFKSSVAEVWNGARFAEMRCLHESGKWGEVPLCAHCDGWTENEHIEERTATHLIRKSALGIYYNRMDKVAAWKGKLAR